MQGAKCKNLHFALFVLDFTHIKLDPLGIMDNAAKDSIINGLFPDDIIPVYHRQLRGDDR